MNFFEITEEEMLQFEDCPDPDVQDIVQEIREEFWANGYRPVAIASHDAKCRSPGKQPFLRGWADDARRSVPGCLERGVDKNQLNTGILCDGLRAIDIDVDDITTVQSLRQVVEAVLGADALIRGRAGSPRILMLYRAAEGQPSKRAISSQQGKIEVLGYGQQFVADGVHKQGAALVWERNRHPGAVPFAKLMPVTEEQIDELLRQAQGILGADKEQSPPEALPPLSALNLPSPVPDTNSSFTLDDARAACAVINQRGGDYDHWLRVGAAIHSIDASLAGQQVFDEWSRSAPNYDRKSVADKWQSFASAPLGRIGGGTLIHLAREAQPGWVSPSITKKPLVPVASAALEEGTDKRQPRLLTLDEITRMPPPAWLLGNLLLQGSAAAVYGPPRSFKSFLVLHMALTLAYGASWDGKAVQRVPVVYVAAEGAGGVGKRIGAWQAEYGLKDADPNSFYLLPHPLDLADAAEVTSLIREIQRVQPKLVIIDTLARCSGSADENSSREMGGVINGALRIRDELGACVLLVHHTGKDSGRGMRGSNRLLGDLDTVIEVVRDDDDPCARLLVRKQKDAEEGGPVSTPRPTILGPSV